MGSTPRTISQRLLGLLLPAVLVPAAVLAAYYAYVGHATEREHLRSQLAISTQLSATAVEDYVDHHLAAVGVMAAVPPPPEFVGTVLRALKDRFPGFVSLLVTDAQGRVLGSFPAPADPGRMRDVSDRQYFRLPAATRRPQVSDAFVGRGLGTDPLVAVSAPLVTEGRFAGVVEASLRIDGFTRERARTLSRRGYEMLLLDSARRVVFASDGLPYRFMQPLGRLPFVDAALSAGQAPAAMRFEGVLEGGRAVWVSGRETRHGWRLYLIASDGMLMDAAWSRVWRLLSITAAIAAAVLLVATWQARRIDRGLAAVMARLRTLARDFDSDLRDTRDFPEELAPVGEAIIELGDNLRRALSDLAGSNAEQTRLTESLRQEVTEREALIAERTADLRTANDRLHTLAHTDALTGLLNLRGLAGSLGALVDGQGVLSAPAAFIALDVDHFKRFNDRYGHPAGDRVLTRVAGALRSALRDHGDLAVRSGGEEFVGILAGGDADVARIVAERIRQLVHALDIRHEEAPAGHVTVSIGLFAAPPGTRLDAALQAADEALYRAKRDGRDRVAT